MPIIASKTITAADQKWRIEFINDPKLPRQNVTSVAVIAYKHDQLLLTRHPHDGWTLPGGHIEPNETFEQAITRETVEEAACHINHISLLGRISLTLLTPKPANYPYPYPTRHCLICSATVKDIDNFKPAPDAIDRKFFPPNELTTLPDKSSSLIDDLTYFIPLIQHPSRGTP